MYCCPPLNERNPPDTLSLTFIFRMALSEALLSGGTFLLNKQVDKNFLLFKSKKTGHIIF